MRPSDEERKQALTTGSIYKKMILFAVPIFISSLFQQLYNTVDALIVGNAIDEKALAAVSAGGSTIFFMIGFVQGLAVGAGVIIARYYGSRSYKSLEKSIHTSVALSFVVAVILVVISLALTPFMLKFLGTPEDVLDSSISYFRIYCLGLGALAINNFGSSILQSTGDSRTPMIYLIISSVTNVIFDLIFIVVFEWGVEGAAVASCIAMVLNALLTMSKLTKMGINGDPCGVLWKQVRFNRHITGPLITQGIPNGLQNSVISISHLVIQSSINLFGSMTMAACAANSRIEGFVFLPIVSFAMALSTFISQNMGAKKVDRVRTGIKFSLVSMILLSELIGVIIFLFAPFFVGLFSQSPEVLATGSAQLRTVSLFYFLLAYSHGCSSILRGLKKPMITMIVFMAAWCVFRIIFVVAGIRLFFDIAVIFWAYPAAWTLSGILFTIFVIKALKNEHIFERRLS